MQRMHIFGYVLNTLSLVMLIKSIYIIQRKGDVRQEPILLFYHLFFHNPMLTYSLKRLNFPAFDHFENQYFGPRPTQESSDVYVFLSC